MQPDLKDVLIMHPAPWHLKVARNDEGPWVTVVDVNGKTVNGYKELLVSLVNTEAESDGRKKCQKQY